MRDRDTGFLIALKIPLMDPRAIQAPSRNRAVEPGDVCGFFPPLLVFVSSMGG